MMLLRNFNHGIGRLFYILLFSVFLLNSCSNSIENEAFDPSVFQYEVKSVGKSYQGCEMGDPLCTYIRVSYPEFKNDTTATNAISTSIKELLFEDSDKSAEVFCQEFIDEYSLFVNEDLGEEEYDLAWYSTADVEILSIQKRVVSVAVRQDNFQGGAHPNSYVYLLNFSPSNGQLLSYDDIFTKENQKELLRLVEHSLRKQMKLGKDDSLNEAGFMLDDDKLILSENFAFTNEGLLFIYNSYEIAPYAMGTITINLPYSLMIHLFDR